MTISVGYTVRLLPTRDFPMFLIVYRGRAMQHCLWIYHRNASQNIRGLDEIANTISYLIWAAIAVTTGLGYNSGFYWILRYIAERTDELAV